MFDNFPVGFEEIQCETIWAWGFSIGHFLECLVYFLLHNGFDQVVVFFICYKVRDILNYILYGLLSILVRFLGYPVEVVYQSCFNILMGLCFYAILVPYLQDFVVGSSSRACSMKKLGVPFSFL